MRTIDGRRGKVFSIRLTAEERALIERAAAKARLHNWAPVHIGGWIVKVALARAAEDLGSTAAAGGSGTTSTTARPRGTTAAIAPVVPRPRGPGTTGARVSGALPAEVEAIKAELAAAPAKKGRNPRRRRGDNQP